MDLDDYRIAFTHIIALIVKYKQTVEYFKVLPSNPNKLQNVIPSKLNRENDDIFSILKDLETIIIPSILHWNHPQFHGSIPIGSDYMSILVEILISGLGVNHLNWTESKFLTKFEYHVTDMFGKLLNLPPTILYEDSMGIGGGTIQNTESNAIYLCLLTARNKMLRALHKDPLVSPIRNLHRLVCYASEYCSPSVIRAADLLQVKFHVLKTDENESLEAEIIEEQILKDLNDGLCPFFICATIGTIECGSIDQLIDISKLIRKYRNIWYHVTAPYAAPILCLPEFECAAKSIRYVDSFDCTPTYWGFTTPNCTCLYVKCSKLFKNTFNHNLENKSYTNYAHNYDDHTQFIGSGLVERKGCETLKLWFMMKCYGKRLLQERVRNHIKLVKLLEKLLKESEIFEILNKVLFGVVCFGLRDIKKRNMDTCKMTIELLKRLNKSGQIYLSGTVIKDKFAIKCYLGHENETENDIRNTVNIIHKITNEFLEEETIKYDNKKSSPDIKLIEANKMRENTVKKTVTFK